MTNYREGSGYPEESTGASGAPHEGGAYQDGPGYQGGSGYPGGPGPQGSSGYQGGPGYQEGRGYEEGAGYQGGYQGGGQQPPWQGGPGYRGGRQDRGRQGGLQGMFGSGDSRGRGLKVRSTFTTTEFWVYVVAVVAILIAAATTDEGVDGQGFGAAEAWKYVTWLTIGYLVSRGLTKLGGHERDTHGHDHGQDRDRD
jgi:hypothetical protein